MPYSSTRWKAPASLLAYSAFTAFLILEGTAAAQSLPTPWSAADIGSPVIQGISTYSAGTFTVTGAGTDIGGTSDQFTFVYQVMSGDGVIVAHVPALMNTSSWAKAGVMIRQSLLANAPNVFAAVTPGRGVIFQRRRVSAGGSVLTSGGSGTVPVWLKIRRRGDVFTAWRSADGVAWQEIGTEIISMPADVDVGLAVTSYTASRATTAQFSQVSVARPDPPTPGLLSWSGADVGLPAAAGSERLQDDDIIVSGAGSIGGTFDQFHYMYRQVSGDADIVARVKAVQYIAAGSRGGVMVRDSLGANATHASMLLRAGSGTIVQGRTVPGGSTSTLAVGTLEPYWVKLRVRGQVVTAFQSPDGVTWSTVASGTFPLPSPYYIGVAVASEDAGTLASVAFDNVRLVAAGANQPPTIALTGPDATATYTAPANVTISADASDPDGTISSVAFYQNGTLLGTVTAAPYTFTWSSVPAGTYTFSAVAYDNAGAAATSDMRTITVNALSNAPPAATLTAPATGSRFAAPATINVSATASDSDGSIARLQFYSGATLLATLTAAPYTFAWTNVQAGTYTLTAVAQDDRGATSTSAASTITVTGGLPSPWQQTDIGSPSAPGSASYSNGTFTIDGRGILWLPDQFHYVYQPFSGDITVTAHVVSMENTNAWATGGVMIRETLTGDSAHASMVLTPGHGANFFYRPTAGASSTSPVSTGSGSWVRLERRGSTITGYQSIDGTTWSAAGSMTLSTASMFVGLAVSSADPSLTATDVLDNVVVRTPTVNQPPTVSLTAPANGTTFTAPASITVSANASDSDGAVANVDFFAGSTLIGTDTTSPYSITWNNVAAASYTLTAVATDNAGATTTSAARSITVTGTSSTHSAVFTASADHATLVTRYVFDIFASGADPNTAIPIASQDLGKPAVVNGDCTADITQTYNALAAGNYIATVSAVGSSGSSRSAPAAFTR